MADTAHILEHNASSDVSGSTPPRSPVAVIDIGSNSIRLVVYEAADRAPLAIFNEKILCGLGRELDATGRLHAEGIDQALVALPRFTRLAKEMGCSHIDMIATAAARDAENGAEFIQRTEAACGHPVRVLSGEEEARLSGLGVLSGTPDADGVMGDLGGGSVELVELGDGETGRQATLPIGPLRLDVRLVSKPLKAREIADRRLAEVPWLDAMTGRTLYLVGGAWRNLARLHMDYINYPLHIIHHYRMAASDALEITDLVSRQSPLALHRVPGVSKRRVETLPYAAMLLHRLLVTGQPKEIVFSAQGLREGCLFDRLSQSERKEDPLIVACGRYMSHEASGTIDPSRLGQLLYDWMSPAFQGESAEEARLRHAACVLYDIARREHPDYRAAHALMRVLRLPAVGLDHVERSFLAVAVASRHSMLDGSEPGMSAVNALLSNEQILAARRIGLATRLAITLSGGAEAGLNGARLERGESSLKLHIIPSRKGMSGEVVARRLAALAKTLNLLPQIIE